MTSSTAPNGRIAGVDAAAPTLKERFHQVRRCSQQLAAPLAPEDCVVQSMPEASPVRWHLAHTTWFFDRLVLRRVFPKRRMADDRFDYLFNSYYNTLGEQFPRAHRGLLSRPTIDEVMTFRHKVDDEMLRLLDGGGLDEAVTDVIETGLHHEQQHQELLLTDVKHMFSRNPLFPAYREEAASVSEASAAPLKWVHFDEGLRRIGADGDGFAYDIERPRHRVFVHAFELASRLVTCGEYLEFMRDGGYDEPGLWLSDGWERAQADGWNAPLYWSQDGDQWRVFTLGGLRSLDQAEPVSHLSFYEADAFARWSDARLPTEAEWELAAEAIEPTGTFMESGRFHPAAAPEADEDGGRPRQLFGDVWEWTGSPYVAYPGYVAPEGALGEYNGKFMCNQVVLRGGSCASPASHIRSTYRNFFYPHCRWQFSGLRLARSV